MQEAVNDKIEMKNAQLTDLSKNGEGLAEIYTCRFIQPGLIDYSDSNGGRILIDKPAIDKMLQSFITKPVVFGEHAIVTPENQKEKSGSVIDAYFNEQDGWYYCDFIVDDAECRKGIESKQYENVSCAFVPSQKVKATSEHNKIAYDFEILDGVFTHLAVVNNPRIERAKIMYNNSESGESTVMYFLNSTLHTKQPKGEKRMDMEKVKTSLWSWFSKEFLNINEETKSKESKMEEKKEEKKNENFEPSTTQVRPDVKSEEKPAASSEEPKKLTSDEKLDKLIEMMSSLVEEKKAADEDEKTEAPKQEEKKAEAGEEEKKKAEEEKKAADEEAKKVEEEKKNSLAQKERFDAFNKKANERGKFDGADRFETTREAVERGKQLYGLSK